MRNNELDPVECQLMGMSPEKAHQIMRSIVTSSLDSVKRQDADMGIETPPPSGKVPDYVLQRTTKVVSIDESQVK